MRLNHDCIRSVLLYVEESVSYELISSGKTKIVSVILNDLYDSLPEYHQEDIWYTVLKLFEGKYVEGWKIPKENNNKMSMCRIEGLTLKGHELIDNIRSESIWNEAKKRTSKMASVSIDILSKVAGTVIAEFAKGAIITHHVDG